MELNTMQICMTTFIDLSALLNVVTVVITAFLLLKKIADMDRFHRLRVVILTTAFCCLIFYVLVVTMGVDEPLQYDYVDFENINVNTMTR
jgi:hypothetical protein